MNKKQPEAEKPSEATVAKLLSSFFSCFCNSDPVKAALLPNHPFLLELSSAFGVIHRHFEGGAGTLPALRWRTKLVTSLFLINGLVKDYNTNVVPGNVNTQNMVDVVCEEK